MSPKRVAALVLTLLLTGCGPDDASEPVPSDLPVDPDAGKIQLFNGRDLQGWVAEHPGHKVEAESVWQVRDGVLVCAGTPQGYLRTEREHFNYELELEWRWKPGSQGGNSGVLVHVTAPDILVGWPRSLEVQLQAGDAGDFWVIGTEIDVDDAASRRLPKREGDLHSHRRIRRLKNEVERPIGSWNRMVVRCQTVIPPGDDPKPAHSVTVHVNDQLVNQGKNCTAGVGSIALQSEGAEIHFRNITIRPL